MTTNNSKKRTFSNIMLFPLSYTVTLEFQVGSSLGQGKAESCRHAVLQNFMPLLVFTVFCKIRVGSVKLHTVFKLLCAFHLTRHYGRNKSRF